MSFSRGWESRCSMRPGEHTHTHTQTPRSLHSHLQRSLNPELYKLGISVQAKSAEPHFHSCRSCRGLWPSWWRPCPLHSLSQEHLQQQNTQGGKKKMSSEIKAELQMRWASSDLWGQSPACPSECRRRCDGSWSLGWRAGPAIPRTRTGRNCHTASQMCPCSATAEQLWCAADTNGVGGGGGGGKGPDDRESHVERKVSCRKLTLYHRAAGKKHQQSQPLKHVHSPAVTQSAVVHTGSKLEWKSCPGKSNYLNKKNVCYLKQA